MLYTLPDDILDKIYKEVHKSLFKNVLFELETGCETEEQYIDYQEEMKYLMKDYWMSRW